MEIFSKAGFDGALLIAHVVVAMMWMGLLWFFNFVQTPAYAEMEPAARNSAFDKLTWRALWWFRWASAATVVFGLLILAIGSGAKNTIFSLPLLVFMVGASHFYNFGHFSFAPGGAKWIVYFLIGLALLVVLELNALGMISGRGNTGLNVIYESHKNAMYTGFALIVGFYIIAEILLRA